MEEHGTSENHWSLDPSLRQYFFLASLISAAILTLGVLLNLFRFDEAMVPSATADRRRGDIGPLWRDFGTVLMVRHVIVLVAGGSTETRNNLVLAVGAFSWELDRRDLVLLFRVSANSD